MSETNGFLSFGMLAGEVSEEGRTDVTSCCYFSRRGSPIYFLPGPTRGGSVCRRLAPILSEASFLLSAWGFHKPWEARRSSGAEPGRMDGAGPSGAHIIAQLCLHHTAKVYVQENEMKLSVPGRLQTWPHYAANSVLWCSSWSRFLSKFCSNHREALFTRISC